MSFAGPFSRRLRSFRDPRIDASASGAPTAKIVAGSLTQCANRRPTMGNMARRADKAGPKGHGGNPRRIRHQSVGGEFPLCPSRQFAPRQRRKQPHPSPFVVETGNAREFLAAGLQKQIADVDAQFLDGLQTVGQKPGAIMARRFTPDLASSATVSAV